jgi:hypothetical protein
MIQLVIAPVFEHFGIPTVGKGKPIAVWNTNWKTYVSQKGTARKKRKAAAAE